MRIAAMTYSKNNSDLLADVIQVDTRGGIGEVEARLAAERSVRGIIRIVYRLVDNRPGLEGLVAKRMQLGILAVQRQARS